MATKRKSPGFRSVDYTLKAAPDYVIAELRYDSSVVIAPRGPGRFAASVAAESKASALNEVLGAFDIKRIGSHFGMPEAKLAARATALTAKKPRVTSDYAHAGFVQIVPRRPKDAARIAERLARSKSVWKAYVAPRPEPAAVNAGASAGSRTAPELGSGSAARLSTFLPSESIER